MSNTKNFETHRWLNRWQAAVLLANPRIAIIEAGRRGGKTEEILPERTLRAMYAMPGSSGTLSGKSYSKLLDQMIPGLIAGWQKRELIEDVDFVVCKTPPKNFKRPLITPKKWDHYILTKWGSGAHLMSFDHGVTSNSLTTDWCAIDEAKQVDPIRVKTELLKTMSGHRSVRINKNISWGDLPVHRQITLLTDKYIGKRDYKWVNDYKKNALSTEQLYRLINLAKRVQNTKDPFLQRELWSKQKDAIAYIEYSSRESLPVIGIEYFRDEFKSSSSIEFRTSILNDDVAEIEGGFYKFLDESIHTYEARNNDRIDTIGINDYLKGKNKNCLLDTDWRKELPLKVKVDYGSAHTWFGVSQFFAETHFTLNNFWTNYEQIEDGVDKICAYYRPHNKKVIELYDDPGGHKRNSDQQRDLDKVIKQFRKHGWHVIHKTPHNYYIPHHVKYRILEKGLDEREGKRDKRFSKIRININNAFETFYSMSKAPLKLSTTGEFQKDKSSEKDSSLEQWKATHLSDVFDMDYCWDNLHLVDESKDIKVW